MRNISLYRDKLPEAAWDSMEAHAEYKQFVSRYFAQFSIDLRQDKDFKASAEVSGHGDFSCARFRTVAGQARYTRRRAEIRQDCGDRYVLYVPVHGTQGISHFDRDLKCSSESLALISMSEPLVQSKLERVHDTVYFFMPREFLDQRVVWRDEVCSLPLSASSGMWRLVRDMVYILQQNIETMSDDEFASAAVVVGDLIVIAASGCTDLSSNFRSVRASNLARAKRIIRSRLSDMDLTLSEVATECGISLRYLHDLFRDDGRTAQEYLRGARLQKAQRILSGGGNRSLTVTEAALASGYSNLSQFSTSFKSMFGVSPKDVLHKRSMPKS